MKISTELKASVIAIAIIIAAIWGFNFLKGNNILKSSNDYFAVFERIDGIVESGTVYIKGYKAGNITMVEYDHKKSGKFVVRFNLEDGIKVPKETEVKVKTSNLIASAKDLELVFSNATEYLQPGDTLKTGINISGMSELLDPITNKINSALLELDSTLYSVNDVFNTETRRDLQKSIKSFNQSMEALAKMATEGGVLYESIKNINSISSELEGKSKKIGESIDNFEAISDTLKNAELANTIRNLNTTIKEINVLVTKINDGDGTISKLTNDSVLYTELTKTITNLDSLLIDLRENPDRYVQVSVFGKKKK